MAMKHVVKLTPDERERMEQIVSKGRHPAWQVQRAYALLKLDRGPQGPGWDDQRVAEAYGMTVRSLESWRRQAVEQGPEALLEREYPPRPQTRKLDGRGQAQLVTLACSKAPDGRDHWTLRLLAEQMVELEIVDSISYETVRRELKKTT